MVDAFLGLGSNLGDRHQYLKNAVTALAFVAELLAESSLYETAPVGGPVQGDYLNQVVQVATDLPARQLLEACQAIEAEAGRDRTERFGPRTVDIDLLLFGRDVIDEAGLKVPHPRMTQRRFVLEPLLEIWPEAKLPDGTPLDSLLGAVADQHVLRVTSNE